jgi:gliding motility-associated-like protein
VKVLNNCFIAVASAFTPNGDGLNDYLYPINAHKARNLAFKVFNRYGQLVFETQDFTKKWDGTFKGVKQHGHLCVDAQLHEYRYRAKVFDEGTSVLIR